MHIIPAPPHRVGPLILLLFIHIQILVHVFRATLWTPLSVELHLLWDSQRFSTFVNYEFLLLGHASVIATIGPTTRYAHKLTLGRQRHVSPFGPQARYLVIILANHLVVRATILFQLLTVNRVLPQALRWHITGSLITCVNLQCFEFLCLAGFVEVLQEVCFQLLSDFNIFVNSWCLFHRGLLCQEVSHFDLAFILIFGLLLLLHLLFQVIYHDDPGHFSLFGLWSIASVADIFFLVHLLGAFTARQNIRIEEGKSLRLRDFYRWSFLLVSSTLWQNPVRYHIGLVVMELYHARWDRLLLHLLAGCRTLGSLQGYGPLVRRNRPVCSSGRLERDYVWRLERNHLFHITDVWVEIIEYIWWLFSVAEEFCGALGTVEIVAHVQLGHGEGHLEATLGRLHFLGKLR